VGRGAAVVEQAARGQEVGAGADRGGAPGTARRAGDPVHQGGVLHGGAGALAARDHERVEAGVRRGQRRDAEADAAAGGDGAGVGGADELDVVGAGALAVGVVEDLDGAEDVERLAPVDRDDEDMAGPGHARMLPLIRPGA